MFSYFFSIIMSSEAIIEGFMLYHTIEGHWKHQMSRRVGAAHFEGS